MINKPTVSELLKNVNNRYELVIATAKRARQISNGKPKLINTDEDNCVTIAAMEINEGKVKVVDKLEVPKNSDELLREQEELELQMLAEHIKKEVEESKRIEEELKEKYPYEQTPELKGVNINYADIAQEINLDDETLRELMNGTKIYNHEDGLSEIDEMEEK